MTVRKLVAIEKDGHKTVCNEIELASYKESGWAVVGDSKPEAKTGKTANTQTKPTKRGKK